MSNLEDIKEQLKAPFALEDIDFLPKGKTERDGKTLCMAFPYADPRVYQDRLNELAYGEWSTPAPVVIAAGNKLLCYVTVILFGVPHTDVGEAPLKADNGKDEENTGTEAWAQAFKRACSQFGLGRYLYDLDKEWVPFNVQRKMIDLDKAGKAAIVRKMYQKAGILSGQAPTPKPVLQTVPAQPQVQDDGTRERLAQVKQLFGTMFNSKGWEKFKQDHLGMPVADQGLTIDELDRLYAALLDKKIAKAS